ncbi:MAG TPA: hypothetical protein VNQ79_22810 [Blastocatellia bacterium]|nr:hypothetical protein [Blastocatellia bacterium]
MARHDEHECAYCAADLLFESSVVGRDWKVYCSAECAEAGACLSESEAARWYRSQIPPEQLQSGIFSSRR